MKKLHIILIVIVIALLAGAGFFMTQKSETVSTNEVNNGNMQIRSLAFENKGGIPAKYTCDGENINPAIIFSNVPEAAESLVLLVHDSDAKDFAHWSVINMPTNVGRIPENASPSKGIEAKNSLEKTAYTGPCPPKGEHEYVFTAYALDIVLNLDETATQDEIKEAMKEHIVEKTKITGNYSSEEK